MPSPLSNHYSSSWNNSTFSQAQTSLIQRTGAPKPSPCCPSQNIQRKLAGFDAKMTTENSTASVYGNPRPLLGNYGLAAKNSCWRLTNDAQSTETMYAVVRKTGLALQRPSALTVVVMTRRVVSSFNFACTRPLPVSAWRRHPGHC